MTDGPDAGQADLGQIKASTENTKLNYMFKFWSHFKPKFAQDLVCLLQQQHRQQQQPRGSNSCSRFGSPCVSGDSSQEERGGGEWGGGERGRENHACGRECVQECARVDGREREGASREVGVKLWRVCGVFCQTEVASQIQFKMAQAHQIPFQM